LLDFEFCLNFIQSVRGPTGAVYHQSEIPQDRFQSVNTSQTFTIVHRRSVLKCWSIHIRISQL
jgi:hypothetical protein